MWRSIYGRVAERPIHRAAMGRVTMIQYPEWRERQGKRDSVVRAISPDHRDPTLCYRKGWATQPDHRDPTRPKRNRRRKAGWAV